MQAIRDAGGEVYAITSEPHSLARNAEQDWQTGFEHVGDPHQEIAGACAERGWLSLFTNDWGEDFVGNGASWVSHPKGYFQPGVLALDRGGRVLYRWRSRPTRQNLGGAIARPTPEHVWGRVEDALRATDANDAAPDDTPDLDARPAPWPLFVLLLLANGWFLEPLPFSYKPGVPPIATRTRKAALRIPFFIGAWVVAAIYLPAWAVGGAFLLWLAKVVPGIRVLHERFQNVSASEEPA